MKTIVVILALLVAAGSASALDPLNISITSNGKTVVRIDERGIIRNADGTIQGRIVIENGLFRWLPYGGIGDIFVIEQPSTKERHRSM